VFGLFAGVALVALILLHELGHAYFVRRERHAIHSVEVFPFFGFCHYSHDLGMRPHWLISAGGVLAQSLVLLPAYALHQLVATSGNTELMRVVLPTTSVLTTTNLLLIAFNLLPIPGFDGAKVWPGLRDDVRQRLHVRDALRAQRQKQKAVEAKKAALRSPPTTTSSTPPSEGTAEIAEVLDLAAQRAKRIADDQKYDVQ